MKREEVQSSSTQKKIIPSRFVGAGDLLQIRLKICAIFIFCPKIFQVMRGNYKNNDTLIWTPIKYISGYLSACFVADFLNYNSKFYYTFFLYIIFSAINLG